MKADISDAPVKQVSEGSTRGRRSLFSGWSRRAPQPTLPPGVRIYAIGDIHGQLALFERLLRAINADDRARNAAETRLVVLGDMIDRGTSVAQLLDFLAGADAKNIVVLMGNHEQLLVRALEGDVHVVPVWLRLGGYGTLESFGVDRDILDADDSAAIITAARAAIPPMLVDWMAQLPRSYRVGDYFFVHAGVKPGVALEAQHEDDLLWIRQPFLKSRRSHGAVIVHGHSPTENVELVGNRIGIDTGAYATGRLSAIGLEDADRWPITIDAPELISSQRDISRMV